MGEVERVHGTYNSTFGHDFRHRVDAASKDKRRGSGGSSQEGSTQESDVVELHDVEKDATPDVPIASPKSDGLDFNA